MKTATYVSKQYGFELLSWLYNSYWNGVGFQYVCRMIQELTNQGLTN